MYFITPQHISILILRLLCNQQAFRNIHPKYQQIFYTGNQKLNMWSLNNLRVDSQPYKSHSNWSSGHQSKTTSNSGFICMFYFLLLLLDRRDSGEVCLQFTEGMRLISKKLQINSKHCQFGIISHLVGPSSI
jgi:hypothetical protein